MVGGMTTLFSKRCVYGIRAVIYLALNHERPYISIKELSEKLDISFHFLTKILQELTAAGLIKSLKGAKGGVGLNKAASKITVYDIVKVLDGESLFEECILGLPGCSDDNPCSLHKYWRNIKKELQDSLQAETLDNVARQIIDGQIRLCEPPLNPKFKTTNKMFPE